MADNTDLSQVPLMRSLKTAFSRPIQTSSILIGRSRMYDFDSPKLIQVIGDDSPLWNAQKKMSMERAVITIPWHQAKSLRDYLTTLVDAYEAVNGEMKQLKLADPKRDA